MGIKLVTFAAQTVTPQDDALIYETALQESGMIYGGVVTIKNANVLHVDAGHGALCGRKFTIEATDVPVPLTASGSLQGRIYIHMDLSDTGEPISFQVETASSLTPVIQQADVNINSGIYEINLATFIVDTSTISNLVNVAPFIDIEPDAEFNAQSNNPVQNKVITKAVGVPETIGGLASQEYNIGDTLVATDGQFYDVIAHISPNATIVLNGNVTLGGNIVDLINFLSSQISNLAKVNSSTGSENVTSTVWTQVARINGLTPGVYIINGFMTFPAVNAGGSRSCRFANPNYSSIYVQQSPPANTYLTENLTDIRVVTSTEDIVFQAFQDCGMTLNCSAWLEIVKLK